MYAMNIQNDIIGLVLRENCKSKQVTDFIAWLSRCHDTILYKLFTFLTVDMEILTPWSCQVHPEVQPKGVQATEGCYNLHIYG
jgi:hypothetical protein